MSNTVFLKDAVDFLLCEIQDLHPDLKKQRAQEVLAISLLRNVVFNELMDMVDYVIDSGTTMEDEIAANS